jgi:hypothetical protein
MFCLPAYERSFAIPLRPLRPLWFNCGTFAERNAVVDQDIRLSFLRHPFAFGSLANWLRLLRDSGGIDRAYMPRLMFILLMSSLTSPLGFYERMRYQRVIAAVALPEPPIFILGHWRSGTTYLHYLLAQDPAFGYITTFQTIVPDFALVGERIIKPLIARGMPATRIIDNMTISLDGPQEDEYAIAGASPYSLYHGWSFPRRARDYLAQYVLFENVLPSIVARWQELYLTTLRKATLKAGNRRLILKSPVNTARLRLMLALFPNAQFIHIYRNPYVVFLSMRRMYQKLLAISQLQAISRERMEEDILLFYQVIMQKYLAERELIPPGNLVEIRYEDLAAQPIDEVRRVYQALNLPGFTRAEAAFRSFIAGQAGYQKGSYALSADVIAKVNRRWQFAFDAWGYAMR